MVSDSVDNMKPSLMPLKVTDLTFHEMAFLKQPRRELQRPLSRKRESDKKRGEREREEISAFFLHKSLPDRYDAQGRKQPHVSGLSSLDGRTGDISAYGSGRPDPRKHSSPEFSRDNCLARMHDHTQQRERKGSTGSTYITWSTSHRSPVLGDELMNGSSGEHNRAHACSSTPIHVREALLRSGIFDNTGISPLPALRLEGEGARSPLEDGFNDAKSAPSIHPNAWADHAARDQPVRIVHYQDRGTMASKEAECVDGHFDNTRVTPTQDESTDAKGGNLVEQEATNIATTVRVPANELSARQPTQVNIACGHSLNMSKRSTPDVEGCGLEPGPERPTSPKWAVIEQLEAAAKDVKTTDHLSVASPVIKQAQAHVLPVGNREPHPTLSSTAVRIAYPYAPGPVYDARWSEFGAAPTFSRELDMLPGVPAPWYPTGPSGESFVRLLTPQRFSQKLAVIDPIQGTDDSPVLGQPSQLRAEVASTQTSRGQQSLQDYIVEIEREVLDRAPEPDDSKTPLITGRDMQDLNMAHLDYEDEQGSMCIWPYIGMSSPAPDQALSSLSQHAQSLEKDEEQRFMSSFWRPNRFPV